jgi:multicomponent Na+:H+ antiporter subunit D
MTDAIVLAVVVPIVASVLTLASGLVFDRSGWYVAALACVTELALAVWVGLSVLGTDTGRIAYKLAGFDTPEGIELVADGLSTPVLVLIAAVSLAVLVYARRAGPRGNAFYTVYLLLITGLTGVTLTGDIFNMYVFLEITGLAAYALVASGDSTRAAHASLKYLIIGTIGASLFLLGAGYAYVATGTLNMVDLSEQLAAAGYTSRLVVAAFGLLVTGLLVKVALFPVHTWQPDAYANAPDSVSAYISALVSTVAAYALARVLLTVFTPDFFAAIPLASDAVVAAGTVSIIAGSVLAVLQSDIKKMLAYSSVSQFGMIVVAFGLLSQTAAVGGAIHLLGHAVLKGGLFAAAGIVLRETGARTIDEYAGLAGRAPVAAGTVAVLGLSLVGVPPSVTFVGKWYIAVGAVEQGVWPVAAVILMSTLLTLAYIARIIERMYFAPATEPSTATESEAAVSADGGDSVVSSPEKTRSVSVGMYAVVVLAAIAAVALGLLADIIRTAFLQETLQGVFL